MRARYPALRVIGERLVLAFRSGRGSVIVDLPLLRDGVMSTSGLQDMPDPVGSHDPVDPSDDADGDDTDPLIPLDEGTGGEWSSSSAN